MILLLSTKKGFYNLCVKTNNSPKSEIAIQSLLRPELTPVGANIDYEVFSQTLKDIKKLFRDSGLEKKVVKEQLSRHDNPSARAARHIVKSAIQSLHTETLRFLLGELAFRDLSQRIYGSDLLADFCGLLTIEGIKGASKSTLERSSKSFDIDMIRSLHDELTKACINPDFSETLNLEGPLDSSVCLIDSTCLESNNHYPIDWLLLKDVSQTLLKAIKLIRKSGLRSRMPHEADCFSRAMNILCMEMTHARRKKDSNRIRKKIFRKMKKLLDTIGNHARKHGARLEADWAETNYTQAQAQQIVNRINDKLELLPKVKKQAHERIIGDRKVSSKGKVLSAHDPDIHVIVRGKSGKELEFGNTLFLAENSKGYILDYQFYIDKAPSEPQQLVDSIERMSSDDFDLSIKEICTDRGFNSKKNSEFLEENNIYDATCPRSVNKLNERQNDSKFMSLQKRRGATEGRISILKNKFHSGKLRAKGGTNRARALGWSVLAHNLWMLSKMLAEDRRDIEKAA
jgi:hypothetical protein